MFTRYHPAKLSAKRKSEMPRQNQGPAFGNNVVASPAARGANKAGQMLPLFGAPLLVVPRSYTALDEQVPALAGEVSRALPVPSMSSWNQKATACSTPVPVCVCVYIYICICIY